MKRYKAEGIRFGGHSNYHIQSYNHVAEAVMTAYCDRTEMQRCGHAQNCGRKAHIGARNIVGQQQPAIVHTATKLRIPASIVENPLATTDQNWRSLHELKVALNRYSSLF